MFEICIVGAVVPEVEQSQEQGVNKDVRRSFRVGVDCNGAKQERRHLKPNHARHANL